MIYNLKQNVITFYDTIPFSDSVHTNEIQFLTDETQFHINEMQFHNNEVQFRTNENQFPNNKI